MWYNKGMTTKQRLFIEHYINNNFNGTQAAISAGYTKKSAGVMASETLKKPYIQKELCRRIKELLSETEMLTLQWLREVKNIASFDIREAVEWNNGRVNIKDSSELSESTAKAISEVSQTVSEHSNTVKVKAHDKMKALDLLGKYLAILSNDVPNYNEEKPKSELDAEARRERIAELRRKLDG
jgi:phage terminase small subunit